MPSGKRLTISNEQAFDRYRRLIESDVRHDAEVTPGEQLILLIQVLAAWGGRYNRRRDIIEGGPDGGETLADTIARTLLTQRNGQLDEQFARAPEWDRETQELIEDVMRNIHRMHPDDPHLYGPSIRRLWAEARQRGLSGEAAWMSIYEWSRHIPDAFRGHEQRVGRVADPALLGLPLRWTGTGDLVVPWEVTIDGGRWQVRLNDFPDEFMYTLLMGERSIGDFHDWPDSWSRPGQAAKETQDAKPRAAAVFTGAAGRWLQRYQSGECEQVWNEMTGLGPDIRSRKYLTAAESVAHETMRRARSNIEVLVTRLNSMGYRFWEPDQMWQRPDEDEKEVWARLQEDGATLPLSLAAWIERVGRVNLNGSHPALAAMEGEPHFHGFYADPLMVAPDAGWTEEEWNAARDNGTAEIEVILGWNDVGKAGLYLDSQVDVMYTVAIPASGADARVEHEWHDAHFIQYLRIAFRWGGFPGWERYSDRPERDLALLSEGLLPL